jgi:hypothetical protein
MLAEPLRLHVPFPCHRLFFITPSSLIHDFLLVNLVFKFLVNTILMDQEHMITIEDTDAAIKRCEQHLQRAATDEGSPADNDAQARYGLPRPRFLRLRWRSRDKIPRLNLLHSRRLPKLRTPRSRRSRSSCAATHRVPSVHAAAPQWTRSLSQCALCVANGGTMPQTVGTSWTPTKQS